MRALYRIWFRISQPVKIFWYRHVLRVPYITYRVRFVAHWDKNATIKLREINAPNHRVSGSDTGARSEQ